MIVNVKFNTTLKIAAFITAEYAIGRLLIDVDLDVDSSLSFWSNFLPINGNYNLQNIDVVKQPLRDRRYCKCLV